MENTKQVIGFILKEYELKDAIKYLINVYNYDFAASVLNVSIGYLNLINKNKKVPSDKTINIMLKNLENWVEK